MSWINVDERLPDPDNPNDGSRVIGFDEFYGRVGEAQLASWNKNRLVFIDSDDCSITHWQPMPLPPTATPDSGQSE